MQHLSRQIRSLHRLVGCFTILLVSTTWGLWFVPPDSENPQIPWFAWGTKVPFTLDILLISALVLAAIGLGFGTWGRRNSRFASLAYSVSLFGLILLDQHRLQPWGLQFLLMAFIFATAQDQTTLKCLRWLAISIYFYSAVSKFDAAFYVSHGQLLLDGLFQAISIDGALISTETRKTLALAFPVGEVLVVLFLLFKSTRRWGVFLSWIMHLGIVLAVGPLGLNHEYGVLFWNGYFVLQNYLLFWRRDQNIEAEISNNAISARLGILAATGITILFLVLPLLENWGWYDHWPAWAVYSSRPEKVTVHVREDAVDEFPNWLKEICGPPVLFEDKVPVSLDRWAFEQRNCPIYPQARYRLGLTKALLQAYTSEDEINIRIEFTPNRRSGEREAIELGSWSEIDQYLKNSFLLNTEARLTQSSDRAVMPPE